MYYQILPCLIYLHYNTVRTSSTQCLLSTSTSHPFTFLFPPPSPGALALPGSAFSDGSLPLLLSSVNCSGSEGTLLRCNYSTDLTGCLRSTNAAGVICQGNESRHASCQSLWYMTLVWTWSNDLSHIFLQLVCYFNEHSSYVILVYQFRYQI